MKCWCVLSGTLPRTPCPGRLQLPQEGGARDGKDIRVFESFPAAVAPGGAGAAPHGGQRVQVQSLQQGVPAEHGAETREDPQWPEAVRVQALLFGLIIDF